MHTHWSLKLFLPFVWVSATGGRPTEIEDTGGVGTKARFLMCVLVVEVDASENDDVDDSMLDLPLFLQFSFFKKNFSI